MGYGLWSRCRAEQRPAHRAVWELFNGPVPEGLIVRHKCDNPRCCNPDHLELGTQKDNVQDCRDRGRMTVGEKHPGSVLTEEQVRELKRRLQDGQTKLSLSKEFGVSRAHILNIARGRKWRHLSAAQ